MVAQLVAPAETITSNIDHRPVFTLDKYPMKRLFVCGDSYMTPAVSRPGTHFAELLAEDLGYELVCLARGGISNLGICLQLQEACQQRADLILINTTTSDRVEIPLRAPQTQEYTIRDVAYLHTASVSSYGSLGENPLNMISDTLYGLLTADREWFQKYQERVDHMPQRQQALRQYFQYLRSEIWQQQIDRWCLYRHLHEVRTAGCDYLMVLSAVDLTDMWWITERHQLLTQAHGQFSRLAPDLDPGYHICEQDQQHIFREILEHLRKHDFS